MNKQAEISNQGIFLPDLTISYLINPPNSLQCCDFLSVILIYNLYSSSPEALTLLPKKGLPYAKIKRVQQDQAYYN